MTRFFYVLLVTLLMAISCAKDDKSSKAPDLVPDETEATEKVKADERTEQAILALNNIEADLNLAGVYLSREENGEATPRLIIPVNWKALQILTVEELQDLETAKTNLFNYVDQATEILENHGNSTLVNVDLLEAKIAEAKKGSVFVDNRHLISELAEKRRELEKAGFTMSYFYTGNSDYRTTIAEQSQPEYLSSIKQNFKDAEGDINFWDLYLKLDRSHKEIESFLAIANQISEIEIFGEQEFWQHETFHTLVADLSRSASEIKSSIKEAKANRLFWALSEIDRLETKGFVLNGPRSSMLDLPEDLNQAFFERTFDKETDETLRNLIYSLEGIDRERPMIDFQYGYRFDAAHDLLTMLKFRRIIEALESRTDAINKSFGLDLREFDAKTLDMRDLCFEEKVLLRTALTEWVFTLYSAQYQFEDPLFTELSFDFYASMSKEIVQGHYQFGGLPAFLIENYGNIWMKKMVEKRTDIDALRATLAK